MHRVKRVHVISIVLSSGWFIITSTQPWMKIDRCRSFRRYTSPEAETNGSTTIIVAELCVSRIFSPSWCVQVSSINRVSLDGMNFSGDCSRIYIFYYKVIREGDYKMLMFYFSFYSMKGIQYIHTNFRRKSIVEIKTNIGVGLFIKRYLCMMKILLFWYLESILQKYRLNYSNDA